jgi:hypothetical protein
LLSSVPKSFFFYVLKQHKHKIDNCCITKQNRRKIVSKNVFGLFVCELRAVARRRLLLNHKERFSRIVIRNKIVFSKRYLTVELGAIHHDIKKCNQNNFYGVNYYVLLIIMYLARQFKLEFFCF